MGCRGFKGTCERIDQMVILEAETRERGDKGNYVGDMWCMCEEGDGDDQAKEMVLERDWGLM